MLAFSDTEDVMLLDSKAVGETETVAGMAAVVNALRTAVLEIVAVSITEESAGVNA